MDGKPPAGAQIGQNVARSGNWLVWGRGRLLADLHVFQKKPRFLAKFPPVSLRHSTASVGEILGSSIARLAAFPCAHTDSLCCAFALQCWPAAGIHAVRLLSASVIPIMKSMSMVRLVLLLFLCLVASTTASACAEDAARQSPPTTLSATIAGHLMASGVSMVAASDDDADCDHDGCGDGHGKCCSCGCNMATCVSSCFALSARSLSLTWFGAEAAMASIDAKLPPAVRGTSPLRPPIA